jgi:hypothetical protein
MAESLEYERCTGCEESLGSCGKQPMHTRSVPGDDTLQHFCMGCNKKVEEQITKQGAKRDKPTSFERPYAPCDRVRPHIPRRLPRRNVAGPCGTTGSNHLHQGATMHRLPLRVVVVGG